MYAKNNETATGTIMNKGKTGFEIQQGAGFREQMDKSNQVYYSTFDIRNITNAILDLAVGNLRWDQRKMIMRTGEWGMVQFHQAVEQEAKLWTPGFDTSRIIGADGKMTFRGQFLKYYAANGLELSVQHEPMNDDKVHNKIKHPSGHGVAESYRYDIMFGGEVGGVSNIRKVVMEGSEEVMGYVGGLRDPFSAKGARMKSMSNPEDGYTVHRAAWLAGIIIDPTKTASFIPNILS